MAKQSKLVSEMSKAVRRRGAPRLTPVERQVKSFETRIATLEAEIKQIERDASSKVLKLREKIGGCREVVRKLRA
jgi:hypothetical protein